MGGNYGRVLLAVLATALTCTWACCDRSGAGAQSLDGLPDIRDVPADLTIPKLSEGEPEPGKRVLVRLNSRVHYVLYLPPNYRAESRHPLIVELAGNGGYRNQYGDVSTGVPEGSKLGYGLTAGVDFAWLCVPFLTESGQEIATQWWGSAPDFSPKTTVEFVQRTVAEVVEQYSLDADAVVLVGFSRGAIACNFVGLYDDEIASLWCGMLPYSHYDGVRDWGLSETDAASAYRRLSRLGDKPQFICHELTPSKSKKAGLAATQAFLTQGQVAGKFQFRLTGFRNHNDAWVLRPSDARVAARKWLTTAMPTVVEALRRIREGRLEK